MTVISWKPHKQAEQRDHGLRDELILLVHGVLHLCGHDHERGRRHREMAEAERGLMRKVGWTGEGLTSLGAGRSG